MTDQEIPKIAVTGLRSYGANSVEKHTIETKRRHKGLITIEVYVYAHTEKPTPVDAFYCGVRFRIPLNATWALLDVNDKYNPKVTYTSRTKIVIGPPWSPFENTVEDPARITATGYVVRRKRRASRRVLSIQVGAETDGNNSRRELLSKKGYNS